MVKRIIRRLLAMAVLWAASELGKYVVRRWLV